MDRGDWRTTIHRVARVRKVLVNKQQQHTATTERINYTLHLNHTLNPYAHFHLRTVVIFNIVSFNNEFPKSFLENKHTSKSIIS